MSRHTLILSLIALGLFSCQRCDTWRDQRTINESLSEPQNLAIGFKLHLPKVDRAPAPAGPHVRLMIAPEGIHIDTSAWWIAMPEATRDLLYNELRRESESVGDIRPLEDRVQLYPQRVVTLDQHRLPPTEDNNRFMLSGLQEALLRVKALRGHLRTLEDTLPRPELGKDAHPQSADIQAAIDSLAHINIIADADTPYSLVVKAIYTAGQAEFSDFHAVVRVGDDMGAFHNPGPRFCAVEASDGKKPLSGLLDALGHDTLCVQPHLTQHPEGINIQAHQATAGGCSLKAPAGEALSRPGYHAKTIAGPAGTCPSVPAHDDEALSKMLGHLRALGEPCPRVSLTPSASAPWRQVVSWMAVSSSAGYTTTNLYTWGEEHDKGCGPTFTVGAP